MKIVRSISIALVAMWAIGFTVPAAAQNAPPQPQDTTQRAGMNLVNQSSGAAYSTLTNATSLAQNRSNASYAVFENMVLQTAAQNVQEISALRGAALGVTLKSFQTMDSKEALAVSKSIAADQNQQTMQMLGALNAGGVANRSQMSVPPYDLPRGDGK